MDDVQCTVSENFNPLYSVAWLADALLHTVDAEAGSRKAKHIGNLTLSEIAQFWRDPAGWNPRALEISARFPRVRSAHWPRASTCALASQAAARPGRRDERDDPAETVKRAPEHCPIPQWYYIDIGNACNLR